MPASRRPAAIMRPPASGKPVLASMPPAAALAGGIPPPGRFPYITCLSNQLLFTGTNQWVGTQLPVGQ
jgi:hypothetical protein